MYDIDEYIIKIENFMLKKNVILEINVGPSFLLI